MKILVLSQVFYPDNVAVSLFMTDLCQQLAKKGHQVKVIAGQYDYEDASKKYPNHEHWQGVEIIRLKNTGFGKRSNVSRLVDFFSFNLLILGLLLQLKKKSYDLIISTTVPPMLSYFVSLFAQAKKIKFCYWAMDLQPELSISAGMVKEGSIAAEMLTRMGDRVFKTADHIFALDDYMRSHIIKRGGNPDKINISQLWPVMNLVDQTERLKNPFRQQNQWHDKLVVMYSGNHSLVHPLATLLEAAHQLRYRNDILFVFIGSGVRKAEVTEFKVKHKLNNIIQLPFQPREMIHTSLGAADLQVVIMGDGQVGYTHPNKIYGALFLGKPIIYIGPEESHVTDHLTNIDGNIMVRHGEGDALANKITHLCNHIEELNETGLRNHAFAQTHLQPEQLKNKMVFEIEQIFAKR